jgi:hypothetical protein
LLLGPPPLPGGSGGHGIPFPHLLLLELLPLLLLLSEPGDGVGQNIPLPQPDLESPFFALDLLDDLELLWKHSGGMTALSNRFSPNPPPFPFPPLLQIEGGHSMVGKAVFSGETEIVGV